MRRVKRGSISSVLLMCGGGVRSILILPPVARDNMYAYGACLFCICCSDCVGVCVNVCCIAAVVIDSVLEPWSVEVCCIFV